jgi:hypothetical protein
MSNLYTIFTQLRGLGSIQGVFCFKGNYVSADSFIVFKSIEPCYPLFLCITRAYLCSEGPILSLFSCFRGSFAALLFSNYSFL